jgi:hypothetical protein
MSRPPAFDDQPLGLTVHSMPDPQDLNHPAVEQTRMGRWKMLLVLLVCAAPVIASYVTYYLVRPDGRRNFGELITPQRTLPDLQATQLNGTPINLQALTGQWLLVSVSGGACDASCARYLYLQRQMREGLGKEKDRLDWVWLIDDDVPVAPELLLSLKAATVLRLPAQDLQHWLEPSSGSQLRDHLYVVDPMGNWMMRFPAQLDAQQAPQAKRDLERLLRASAFWDKPGR